jgi:hypothetical protein
LNPAESPLPTPGHDFPGAFPSSNEIGLLSTHSVGESLADTARTYLPQSVINTVDAYFGTHVSSSVIASSNDVPHRPSLPTQEVLGARSGEQVDGVGSLPGTNFESGVAKLPDERSAEAGEKTHTIPGYIATAKEALGQFPPKKQNQSSQESSHYLSTDIGVSKPLDERNSEISRTIPGGCAIDQAKEAVAQIKTVAFDIMPVSTNQTNSSPTEETSRRLPGENLAEVGALSGDKHESGVAPLPDQRQMPVHDEQHSLSAEKQEDLSSAKRTGSTSVGIAGVPNTGASVEEQKGLPPKPKSTSSLTKRANGTQRFPGDEEGYHPADPHPMNEHHPQASEDDRKSALSDPSLESTHSGGGSGGSPKKVGFKERVTGGSKVLLGKLGHNQGKVEEGRKILHGEA